MLIKYDLDPRLKDIEGGILKAPPIVIYVTKFDDDSAKLFSDQMNKAHNTGQDCIPIIINSYGGEVYSLMSMISDIQSADVDIATFATGKAMSAGAILFSFGTEGFRFIDPNATMMIHDVSDIVIGKTEDIKADASEVDRLNNIIFTMVSKNCGKPADYFLKKIHEKSHADWFLDAKEAKKHNLANHIKVPRIDIAVEVRMELSA